MKTKDEFYEICDIVAPHIKVILKNLEGLGIGLAVSSDGGEIVLYEQEKGIVHEHHATLDSDMTATGWHVEHQFTREEIDEYHQYINRRFDLIMGTDQWGGYVGVIQ